MRNWILNGGKWVFVDIGFSIAKGRSWVDVGIKRGSGYRGKWCGVDRERGIIIGEWIVISGK